MNRKTKFEQKWFGWGYGDQKTYGEHPEQILQESWELLKKDIDKGVGTWSNLVSGFPHYKLGVLKATKELKI